MQIGDPRFAIEIKPVELLKRRRQSPPRAYWHESCKELPPPGCRRKRVLQGTGLPRAYASLCIRCRPPLPPAPRMHTPARRAHSLNQTVRRMHAGTRSVRDGGNTKSRRYQMAVRHLLPLKVLQSLATQEKAARGRSNVVYSRPLGGSAKFRLNACDAEN